MTEIKNEILYQRFFEFSKEGLLLVDNQGKVLKTNNALDNIFGCTSSELVKKELRELIPELLRENDNRLQFDYIKNHIQRAKNKNLPIWGIKKEGLRVPLDVNINPIHVNGEELVVAFVSDITEHELERTNLAKSERNMAEAQRLAKVGSWFWNLKTRERNWSDEFYRICGLPPKDVRLNKETILQFIHLDDREQALKMVQEAIKNHAPYTYEKRILRPDNQVRYVKLNGKTIFDTEGEPWKMFGTIQDITDIKKREAIISETSRKFDTLVNNLQGIVYRCSNSRNYEMAYINNYCLSVTGYNFKEFEEHKVHYGQLILEDDRDNVWKNIQKAIRKNTPYSIQYRIRSRDNTIKYVWEQGEGVFDSSGKVLFLEGYISDITLQKRLELDLKISVNKNRAILKALPDLILELDYNGVCIGIYAQDDSMLVLPKNELIGKNICDVLPNKLCETIRITLKNCEITNETQTIQYSLTINNELRYFEARIVLSDKHKYLAIIRDITINQQNEIHLRENEEKLLEYAVELENKIQERTRELQDSIKDLVETNLNLKDQIQVTKEAEEKLIRSQAMLKAIAKNFPNGVIVLIDKKYKILYIDGKGLNKMRLMEVLVIGKNIDQIRILKKDQKLLFKTYIEKTLSGELTSFDLDYQNNNFLVNTTPIYDVNQNVSSAMLVFIDNSRQKLIEQNMLNSLQKERELNELKSRFISMASHEFRTPLTAISSSAILIGKQNEPGKEEKRLKYITQIKKNIENLVVILNDFLSLGKLEEGKVLPKSSSFNLIDFSKSIIQEISPILKVGQAINFMNDQSEILVFLDQKLMHQILINILSNALKYSLEDKIVTFSISSRKERVQMKIKDQGIGIPHEEQANIFQRFYRAQNTNNIQGTGLGLSIAKNYIELMNGHISFKSKLNKGTTFIIEIPLTFTK